MLVASRKERDDQALKVLVEEPWTMTPDDWWRVRILELVNDITCVKLVGDYSTLARVRPSVNNPALAKLDDTTSMGKRRETMLY